MFAALRGWSNILGIFMNGNLSSVWWGLNFERDLVKSQWTLKQI